VKERPVTVGIGRVGDRPRELLLLQEQLVILNFSYFILLSKRFAVR
jgi:hypothetical protein